MSGKARNNLIKGSGYMGNQLALLGGNKTVRGKVQNWPPISQEEINLVSELARNSEVSYYGREGVVGELEDEFNKYHDIKYSLAVSSGTAALHSAFVGCDIGPGDEVIAPTHTFLATVTPILMCNAIPVLVDCDEDTEGINPKGIEAAITDKTKAIVVTHLWGHPVEMDEVMSIAKKHNLKVIEDCSHAHGSTYRGRKVGTIGDVGCFSLQGKKIVAAGQGGILITNNQEIYEKAVLLGHFNVRAAQTVHLEHLKKFVDTGYGLNLRMHPFAGALALVQFKEIDARIKLRCEKLDYFTERLSGLPGIRTPITKSHVTRGAYYGYKLRYVAEELQGLSIETFIKAMQAEGAKVKGTGSAPLHLSNLFSGTSDGLSNFTHSLPSTRQAYKKGDLPISEKIFEVSLSLPTFTYEPYSLIDEYVDAFKKVIENVDQLSGVPSV